MEKFKKTIIEAKNSFNEDDLHIGKKLADGCYNQHRGYEFTITTLASSNNYDDVEMYHFFNTTKEEFWNKIKELEEDKQKLYLQALYEFCSYLGID